MNDEQALDEIRDMQAALLRLMDSEPEPGESESVGGLLASPHAHQMAEIALRALPCVLERHLEKMFEEPADFEWKLVHRHADPITTFDPDGPLRSSLG